MQARWWVSKGASIVILNPADVCYRLVPLWHFYSNFCKLFIARLWILCHWTSTLEEPHRQTIGTFWFLLRRFKNWSSGSSMEDDHLSVKVA